MKVFVDTNVALDFILQRKEFYKAASALFDLADKNLVKIYIAAHTITNSYYLLNKVVGDRISREQLVDLLDIAEVVRLDKAALKQALLLSEVKDYEDALQIVCALQVEKLQCIVTRNRRDYKNAPVPVYSPEELLKELKP